MIYSYEWFVMLLNHYAILKDDRKRELKIAKANGEDTDFFGIR